MKQLAEDVYLLRGMPPNAINVYLVGDVLIDASTSHAERLIMRQIADRTVTAHALTHAHPDHQGSSHAVCERLGIPLWCGQGDIPAMETPGGIKNSQAPGWLNRFQARFWTGPPHPVARARSRKCQPGGVESPTKRRAEHHRSLHAGRGIGRGGRERRRGRCGSGGEGSDSGNS